MSGFSEDLSQKICNYFFRNATGGTPPTSQCYLGLCIADPTDNTATALTNEISAGWYARQSISFDAPSISAGTVITANTGTVTFPAVTGSAVTVTHWALFDALTTGNLRASGALTASKVLNVGDVPTWAAGDFDLTLD